MNLDDKKQLKSNGAENLLFKLYQSPKTILTTKDIALLWQETDKYKLNNKIAYYAKRGNLIRLRPGIFAKSKDYEPRELGTSIYSPSYISFETVLRENGIIFQHYETIFLASYTTREIKCNGYTFSYRKLKDEVLYNQTGIVSENGYGIAEKERAFLDMIYLFPDYHFDNLKGIAWDKCFELVKIYKNKELTKRLNRYYKSYAQ